MHDIEVKPYSCARNCRGRKVQVTVRAHKKIYKVSPVQKAVVLMAALGMTTRDISKVLRCQRQNIKNHLSIFYRANGISDRIELRAFVSAHWQMFVKGTLGDGEGVRMFDFVPLSNQQVRVNGAARRSMKTKDLVEPH